VPRWCRRRAILWAIRLPANDALLRHIEPLLTRAVGRPSNARVIWYAGFLYQAQRWDRARRVVAKVEWHNGELFPRVGFIVTNLSRPAKRVVRFYNQRGPAEQWIKEGKNALKWTRLSCHDCVDNKRRRFAAGRLNNNPADSRRRPPCTTERHARQWLRARLGFRRHRSRDIGTGAAGRSGPIGALEQHHLPFARVLAEGDLL